MSDPNYKGPPEKNQIRKAVVVKDARNLVILLQQFPDADVQDLITEKGEDCWRVTFTLLETP